MRFVLFLLTATLTIAGQFATSIGDQYPYVVSAMTTDSAGNTYIVGIRALLNATLVLPTAIVTPNNMTDPAGGSDMFITKLDPAGKLLFTDTFGGDGANIPTAITVDPTGNIYIAGNSTSDDFVLNNALQTQPNPDNGGTGFIIKLNSTGTTILYSTYLGGVLGATGVTALTTDAKGNLYVTGTTFATDFPHTSGMPFGPLAWTDSLSISGAFVTSISAAGDKFLYSGVISGSMGGNCFLADRQQVCEIETGSSGISVDAAGNAYIVGDAETSGLPLTSGTCSAQRLDNTFMAKVNPGGAGLNYLVCLTNFLGVSSAVTGDAAGNIFVGGSGSQSGFVAKFKSDATPVWNTSVGNLTRSIAIDAKGNVWTTGLSYPNLIPNPNGWTTGTEFVAGFNAAGTLTYSALYPSGTAAQSVAVDPSGIVHFAGSDGFVSAFSPTTAPSNEIFCLQNAAGGNATARVSPAEVIAIYGPGIGPTTPVTAAPLKGLYPTTLGGVQVTINGIDMPLLYVSANQINAVVPMEVAQNAAATVQVINGVTSGPTYPVWIVSLAPQAFPGVLNQDGTLNSQTNPAKSGSIVTFYVTGWQPSFAPLADGQVQTTAQDLCQGSCTATPGGTVLYGGAAPGIVAGVSQFNIQLGDVTVPGSYQIQVNNIHNPAEIQAFVTQTVWITP